MGYWLQLAGLLLGSTLLSTALERLLANRRQKKDTTRTFGAELLDALALVRAAFEDLSHDVRVSDAARDATIAKLVTSAYAAAAKLGRGDLVASTKSYVGVAHGWARGFGVPQEEEDAAFFDLLESITKVMRANR